MNVKRIIGGLAALAAFAIPGAALAQEEAGRPHPWQMGLQDAVSPIMERIHGLHDFLLVVITVITIIVLALLVWVMIRYREKANPEPSKVTHNTLLEVVWTVVPILILVAIAIPSMQLLYLHDDAASAVSMDQVDIGELPENATDEQRAAYEARREAALEAAREAARPTMTITARGHQWYWSYDYENEAVQGGDGFRFEARLVQRTHDPEEGSTEATAVAEFREAHGRDPIRLLDTNNQIVIPVNTTVRVLVRAVDVIHSWTVPAFGVKVDAVPGRVNEIWIRADQEGTFYGQCSELCGADHAFMPITVRAVPRAEYDQWVEQMRQRARDAEIGFTLLERPQQQAENTETEEAGE